MRASLTAIALAATLCVAVGCSDSESRDPAATIVDPTPTKSTLAPTPSNEDIDGKLTTTDGKVITNWGEPGQRKEAIATFTAMTRAFRGGRMRVACSYVSDFGLGQFTPGGVSPEASCPVKLKAFARVVAQRGGPPTARVLWVRAYTGISGVWVEDGRGRRVRVPFSDYDGDGWKLELGIFDRPDMLAARVVRGR